MYRSEKWSCPCRLVKAGTNDGSREPYRLWSVSNALLFEARDPIVPGPVPVNQVPKSSCISKNALFKNSYLWLNLGLSTYIK